MKPVFFFRRLTPLLLLLAGLLLGSCNFGTAPGGTEGEGLTGILLDTRGAPVKNVKVRAHPDTAATLAKASAVKAATEDSVFTNTEGRFDFTKLVKGSRYNLSASFTRDDTVYSLLIKDIVYGGGRQDLGNNALVVSGGITLRIQIEGSAPPAGSLCSIANSPFQSAVTDSGTCVLTGLPPGVFQVEVVAPGYRIALSDAVTVIQRVLQNGGSVNLVPLNGPVPNDSTIPATALVAWWDFEEGSGTQVLDKSGNGHTGTLTGSAVWVTDGVSGKALSFDGTTQVQVPASPAFSALHGSFTFSVWTRQSSQSQRAPVMEFGLPADYAGTHLWLNTTGSATNVPGSVYAHLRNAVGPASTPTPDFNASAGTLAPNAWSHVVLTYDSASGQARIYANGVLTSTRNFTTLPVPSTEGLLYMGFRPADSKDSDRGLHFTGQMDDLRIYKQALTPAQIGTLYRAGEPSAHGTGGAATYFPKTSATIAQWTFDENANGKFADLSGNGHELTAPAASTLAASPNGSAVTFNGALITRTDNALMLVGNTRITYEARIRLSAYPSASLLNRQSHLIGNYAGLSLYIGSEGWIQVVAQKGSASSWNWWGGNTLPGTVPLNQWVDVAAAADRTTGKVYAYVNGKPVVLFNPAADLGGTLRAYDASSFDLGGSSVDGQLFPGQIEEVRVSSDLPLGAGPDVIVAPYSNPDPARVFPAVPALVDPAQGAAVSTPVSLSWGSVTEASVYFVEVATDSAFTNNVFSDSLVLQTSRAVAGLTDGSYFWRVRARNGAGTSGYSAVRRFAAAGGN